MTINFNLRIKKLFWSIFAVVFIIVFVVMLLKNPAPKHIVDTNGEDNYSLQVITEQDIIEAKMGTRGGISEKQKGISLAGFKSSKATEYSSEKFTGVYELYSCQIFEGSALDLSLLDFEVDEGNFKFYIVFDDEIIGSIEPDDLANFKVEKFEKTGTLRYIIAGESAEFEFMAPTDWA